MLNHLQIRNFLGLRDLDVDLTRAPVHLFCGPNKVGKSTIRDALRFALLDDPGRADKKKDYGSLLSDGAKSGVISLDTTHGAIVRDVATGKREGDLDVDALGPVADVVLDADRFAAFSDNERRRRLMEVTGVHASRGVIIERLAQRGLTSEDQKAKIESLTTHLRGGFEAGNEEARRHLRYAKSKWEAITGEKYGSNKAESWVPPAASYDPKRIEDLTAQRDERRTRVDGLREDLGEIRAKVAAASDPGEDAKLAKTVKDKRKSVDQAREKLQEKNRSLDAYREAIDKAVRQRSQFECPKCEARLRLDPDDPEKVIEADAPADNLPDVESMQETVSELRVEIGQLEQNLEAAQRELAEAEAAEKRIAEGGGDEDLASLKKRQADVRSQLDELNSEIGGLEEMLVQANQQRERAERAREDEQLAREQHAHAQDWQAIADALAPDGIPAELLAEALGPVNDRLRLHAELTGWGQVRIESDMRITVDGRVYRLLSESERWRADACIAETLSHLSGLGLLILDRLDVLDVPSRKPALDWMRRLARDDGLQVLVMGTLKSAPGSSEDLAVHWLGESQQAAA